MQPLHHVGDVFNLIRSLPVVMPAVHKKGSHEGACGIFNLIKLITIVIAVITAK